MGHNRGPGASEARHCMTGDDAHTDVLLVFSRASIADLLGHTTCIDVHSETKAARSGTRWCLRRLALVMPTMTAYDGLIDWNRFDSYRHFLHASC